LLIWGLRAWNSCVNVKRRHYHFNPKGLKCAVRPWGNKTMRTINRCLTDVLQFWPGYWTAGVLSWMPKSTIPALFVGSKCKFLPCSKLITLAVSGGVNGTDYASYWLPCRRRCFTVVILWFYFIVLFLKTWSVKIGRLNIIRLFDGDWFLFGTEDAVT